MKIMNNKIILNNSPFMELSFLVKNSYTLYELQHCKKYNLIRKSIPYNEQYEQRDFVWEKNISKKYKEIRIPSLKDLVNVNVDVCYIPDKLTITNIISLELMNIINKNIDSSMKK